MKREAFDLGCLWRSPPRRSLLLLALLTPLLFFGACSLELRETPPFAFTNAALFRRTADDGVTELVFSYGLENRGTERITGARARMNLFRGRQEPELLISVESDAELSVAPGAIDTVETILNPTLYYDPGPELFMEGLRIVQLRYRDAPNWTNPLGRFVYPYEIALSAGTEQQLW